jgi:hypothetical protein
MDLLTIEIWLVEGLICIGAGILIVSMLGWFFGECNKCNRSDWDK